MATYSYQWRRSGLEIAGATLPKYQLRPSDEGQSLACSVTTSNSVGSSTVLSASSAVVTGSGASLGVLNADAVNVVTDAGAGIQLAEIECGWNEGEPSRGSFSSSYLAQQVSIIRQYAEAGYQVAVSVGLQYPPSWVTALENGQYVDQFGSGSGTPNFAWNPAIRGVAAEYVTELVRTIADAVDVDYYRIGLAPSGEMFLPNTISNQWWAFDTLAQGPAAALPTGIGACPMVGWFPGSSQWKSMRVTVAMATAWWNWYVDAVINAHAWEMETFRSAGWAGTFQLLMPGTGAVPGAIAGRLESLLAPVPGNATDYTMNGGSAWHLQLAALDLANCVVDVSSVYDGSGVPPNNSSAPGDGGLSLQEADPWLTHWSATRWLAYLARAYDIGILGENPGSNVSQDVSGIMRQAAGCGLVALMWADDEQLYNPDYATLQEVSSGFSVAFQ